MMNDDQEYPAQRQVLLPRWNGRTFIMWPHVPFFEIRPDGSGVLGYRPLDVKYVSVIE